MGFGIGTGVVMVTPHVSQWLIGRAQCYRAETKIVASRSRSRPRLVLPGRGQNSGFEAKRNNTYGDSDVPHICQVFFCHDVGQALRNVCYCDITFLLK